MASRCRDSKVCLQRREYCDSTSGNFYATLGIRVLNPFICFFQLWHAIFR